MDGQTDWWTDGLTDGQCDFNMPPEVPLRTLKYLTPTASTEGPCPTIIKTSRKPPHLF